MLDNMEPSELKLAAESLKSNHPHVLIEASGGITMATMHMYMSPHVDVISRGNLTQGYDVLDFSLKITKGLNQNAESMPNPPTTTVSTEGTPRAAALTPNTNS